MNNNEYEIIGIVYVLLFSVFVLPFLIYVCFDLGCFLGLTDPLEAPPAKRQPKPEPEPVQDSEWSGTWNDKPDDSWFNPEPTPQTDPQLIEDTIGALQQIGFKKRDAKLAVLKACEGKVFEDHEPLIKAALDKSNL